MKGIPVLIGLVVLPWLVCVAPPLAAKAQRSPTIFNIGWSDVDAARQFLDKDPSLIRAQDDHGETPLYRLCNGASSYDGGTPVSPVPMVKLFVSRGADIDLIDPRYGNSLLMTAQTSAPQPVYLYLLKLFERRYAADTTIRPRQAIVGSWEDFRNNELEFFSDGTVSVKELNGRYYPGLGGSYRFIDKGHLRLTFPDRVLVYKVKFIAKNDLAIDDGSTYLHLERGPER